MKETHCSERVKMLRKYYIENAPMSVEGNVLDYVKDGSARILYTKGWIEGKSQPTTRLRRSYAESYMLKNLPPVIDDGELIVGQPHLPKRETEEQKQEYDKFRDIYFDIIPQIRGRESHMGLDYHTLLSLGVNGIIAQIKEKKSQLDENNPQDIEKFEFYTGCLMELEALLVCAKNYACYARKLACYADEKRKAELEEIARILDNVPAKPASSFREALQSVHFFTFNLFGLYSGGRPDEYLYPYYKHDIDNKIITEDEAQELIDCYCLQYITTINSWAACGFMLGGRDSNGQSVENELTWMFLRSIPHTHAPDPNIGLCVTDETTDELLNYACTLLSHGNTHPALWNDNAVTASLIKNGFDESHAHQYTHSTCVEITPIGCSGMSVTSPYVNVAQTFLRAFNRCDTECSFEDIVTIFKDELMCDLRREVNNENMYLMERARNGTDALRVSCLVNDCIKRGKSHENGGALYNQLEADFIGIINVAECLNSIYKLVYCEKKCTLAEFQNIVKNNYKGNEDFLTCLQMRDDHFGNDDEASNKIMKMVADIAVDCCKKFKNYRGDSLLPGAFSYNRHFYEGQNTCATPDGRVDFSPLSDGSGPVQGYDVSGATALLKSVTSWEPSRFLGGIAMNVKLNKDIKDLSTVIKWLAKSYFKLGGPQMQINVTDAEELRKAQKNPSQYRDLLVRIGGYSDFFVKQDCEMQNEIISRTEQKN